MVINTIRKIIYLLCILQLDHCGTDLLFPIFPVPKWGEKSVTQCTYEKDKKQIETCFLNNVEYYRSHFDDYYYTDSDSTEIWSTDLRYFYLVYARKWDTNDRCYKNQNSSARSYLDIHVDTIVYNKAGTLCIAFYWTYNKQADYREEYSAGALIGYRKKETDSLDIYPASTSVSYSPKRDRFQNPYFLPTGQHEARLTELVYFYKLKYFGEGGNILYKGMNFEQRLAEDNFFDECPYFMKYNDSLYYFQMYQETIFNPSDTIRLSSRKGKISQLNTYNPEKGNIIQLKYPFMK